MLKILPIIPSRTSQIFDPLFLHHRLLFLLFIMILYINAGCKHEDIIGSGEQHRMGHPINGSTPI